MLMYLDDLPLGGMGVGRNSVYEMLEPTAWLLKFGIHNSSDSARTD